MKKLLLKASNMIPLTDTEASFPSLSVDVFESSVVTIIGAESSGKTLWLRTLNGLNAMAQGELSLLGYDVRQLSRQDWLVLHKDISYVGQDTALLSAYTLMENILLPGLHHKLDSRDQLIKQVYALLEEIGFDDMDALNQLPAFVTPLKDYYARMVRALIVKPKLLFLDDLYAHLSSDKITVLGRFLMQKVEQTGLALVLTTDQIKQTINESAQIVFISSDKIYVFENRNDFLSSNDDSVKQYLFSNGIHSIS